MRSFIGLTSEIGMSRSNNRSCPSGVLTRRNRKNLLWFINGQSASLRHYVSWGRLCRTITTGCYIPIYHQITVLSVRARSAHIFSSWLISTRKLIASRGRKGTCCRSYYWWWSHTRSCRFRLASWRARMTRSRTRKRKRERQTDEDT